MSEERTIWVDLTDIYHWEGNFTGIQRMVYNIASRYAALPNVRFFILQSTPIAISFISVEIGMIRALRPDTEQQTARVPSEFPAALLRRIKRAIAGNPTAYKYASKIRNQANRTSSNKPVEGPFRGVDTVLVLGGNWGNVEYMPALKKLKNKSGFRFIHVVYDLVPALLPGYVPPGVEQLFTTYMKDVYGIADDLIAISESTKKDLEKFQLRVGERSSVPTHIAHLGDDAATPGVGTRPKNAPVDGFILFVSTMEVRKNHALLYYTIQLAKQRGILLPKFVFVGKAGWLAGDIRYMFENDTVAKAGTVLLNSVTDAELDWLYSNCLFTIYPSFYEGWGLPIAESLVRGKPCISSNTSSMPEVGGNLVDYFSPNDPAECLGRIVEYLKPGLLSEKGSRIRELYTSYSWDDTFRELNGFVSEPSSSPVA